MPPVLPVSPKPRKSEKRKSERRPSESTTWGNSWGNRGKIREKLQCKLEEVNVQSKAHTQDTFGDSIVKLREFCGCQVFFAYHPLILELSPG